MILPGRSRLFPTVSDCFRLFPTVSSPLEGQRRPWTIDSTKIATVNTLLHDPCAGRLLEMMHFDFKTQYTLRIPKFQDLVKFNNVCIQIYIYICNMFFKMIKQMFDDQGAYELLDCRTELLSGLSHPYQ